MTSRKILVLSCVGLMAYLGCASPRAQAAPVRPSATPPTAAELPLVLGSADGLLVAPMRSFSNGTTADAHGGLWTLVQRFAPGDADRRELWLVHSADRGRSWQQRAKVPTAYSAWGAVAGEPERSVLHVAWAGHGEQERWTSALYQLFDVRKGAFVGEPEVLQRGVGAEDQFGVCDLGIGDDGEVAVIVSTHRRPKQPPWPSGWSSGLMLRGPNDPGWRGPFPWNTNTYGVWTNLQLVDGVAHASYRTSPSRSVIGYRSFALDEQTFEQQQDVVVSIAGDGREVANASSLLVGPFGGRTVVYPSARQSGARDGRLLLAYAEPGDTKWQTSVLAEDPDLRSGNLSHEHFALVKGPGRQAIALFSKTAERHRVLYRRIYDGGRPMEDARAIATSELDGAFSRISAVRDARLSSPVWALVSANGDDPAARLGVRAVLAPQDAPARWQ